jgi:toxin ParE1/3/4
VTRRTVELRPQVAADVKEISVYIAKDNTTAALAFIEAVESTLETLTINPQLGRLRSFRDSRLAGVRCFPVKGFSNFLIFYELLNTEEQETISIIRILHTARNIDSIFH